MQALEHLDAHDGLEGVAHGGLEAGLAQAGPEVVEDALAVLLEPAAAFSICILDLAQGPLQRGQRALRVAQRVGGRRHRPRLLRVLALPQADARAEHGRVQVAQDRGVGFGGAPVAALAVELAPLLSSYRHGGAARSSELPSRCHAIQGRRRGA